MIKTVSIRVDGFRLRQRSRRIIRDMIRQFLEGTSHGLIRVPFTYPYYEATTYGHTKFELSHLTNLTAYDKIIIRLRKEVNAK